MLFHLVAHRIGLSSFAYLRGLAPALLATFIMMACVVIADRFLLLPQAISSGAEMFVLISVGILTYVPAVLAVARREVVDVWKQIRTS
jgi:hypothetical protein